MGLKDWPFAGFPGTAVNPQTLLPEVVNEEKCAAALEGTTDVADHVFVLLARGLTNEAAELAASARLSDPGSVRLQVLDAEILRATKQYDRAERVLKALIPQVSSTSVEAWIHQQLGKVYFSSGHYDSAARSFSLALEQRVAAGADASAIYSSTVSLQRAKDLAERQ